MIRLLQNQEGLPLNGCFNLLLAPDVMRQLLQAIAFGQYVNTACGLLVWSQQVFSRASVSLFAWAWHTARLGSKQASKARFGHCTVVLKFVAAGWLKHNAGPDGCKLILHVLHAS